MVADMCGTQGTQDTRTGQGEEHSTCTFTAGDMVIGVGAGGWRTGGSPPETVPSLAVAEDGAAAAGLLAALPAHFRLEAGNLK